MKCRGKKIRRKIIEEYDINPVVHIQLLADQIKESDAGGIIKNEYYIFEAIKKIDSSVQIIICGMTVAKDFLNLVEHDGLPIFNPLLTNRILKNNNQNNFGNKKIEKEEEWNKVAKQLYNAILWLILLLEKENKTTTILYEFIKEVVKYKKHEPFFSKIKRVNTYIGKCFGGIRLTEKINKLKKENNIRVEMCQFNLLVDCINKTNEEREKNKIEVFF